MFLPNAITVHIIFRHNKITTFAHNEENRTQSSALTHSAQKRCMHDDIKT